MLLNVTLEMGLATPCASVSLSKPKRMRSSPRLPSSSSVLQFHICDPCDPYRIKRCSQVTKGTKGRKSMCGCQEGRSTLTPRRQGSPGRPIPALGWQRTPGLPPQGENWAQAGELEKEMATHSSVLAWRIPGTGEPCGLPSMGSHRVRHD